MVHTMSFSFFALLLVLAELRLKIFLKYFNFLAGCYGKAIYIVFLGTIILGGQIYEIIVGIIIIVGGVAYAFVCKNAEYGDEVAIEEMNKEADEQMEIEVKAEK